MILYGFLERFGAEQATALKIGTRKTVVITDAVFLRFDNKKFTNNRHIY